MSFIAGFALVLLCLKTELIPASASKSTTVGAATSATLTQDKSKLFLGAAIQNGLISVPEVKMVLHHLGTYNGSINDDPSEIYFKAVGNFQLSQNIPADGLVGPVTYGKLREVAPQFRSFVGWVKRLVRRSSTSEGGSVPTIAEGLERWARRYAPLPTLRKRRALTACRCPS